MIMNQMTGLQTGDAARPVDRRIRHVLEKRQAMNLAEISRALVLDPGVVVESLSDLVGAGEVERLRPVAYMAEDCDFYRLRRLDDQAFLWEQRYLEIGTKVQQIIPSFNRQVRRWLDRNVL